MKQSNQSGGGSITDGASNNPPFGDECQRSSNTYDLQLLIGFLLLLGVAAAVGLVSRRGQKVAKNNLAAPVSLLESPMRFAALVTVPDAPGLDLRPAQAPDMVANAGMRWAGPAEEWDSLSMQMSLKSVEEQASLRVGEDVILVYSGVLRDGSIPTDRVSIRASMRKSVEAGQLRFVQMFARPASLNPSEFGFSIG